MSVSNPVKESDAFAITASMGVLFGAMTEEEAMELVEKAKELKDEGR